MVLLYQRRIFGSEGETYPDVIILTPENKITPQLVFGNDFAYRNDLSCFCKSGSGFFPQYIDIIIGKKVFGEDAGAWGIAEIG